MADPNRDLTRAIEKLDRTMDNVVKGLRAINSNLVSIGRMFKDSGLLDPEKEEENPNQPSLITEV